jgi:hypothetical protein
MDPYKKKHKRTARNKYCRVTRVSGGSTCVRLSFWILRDFTPLLSLLDCSRATQPAILVIWIKVSRISRDTRSKDRADWLCSEAAYSIRVREVSSVCIVGCNDRMIDENCALAYSGIIANKKKKLRQGLKRLPKIAATKDDRR